MGKWKNCSIADIGTVVGGATPSTKKSANYNGGTIPWITPKDLSTFRGRYISRGERNITKAGLDDCAAQLLPAHTVLFSSRAPIGYIAIAQNEVCTNQGFKSVIPNENTDPLFLYYLLKFNKNNIENMGSGTTFKEVSGKTMKGILVRVPVEIREQKIIGQILGALDDKIELNNAMNKNLEQQATAIYKLYVGGSLPSGNALSSSTKFKALDEFCNIFTGRKNANASEADGKYKFFTCAPDALKINSYIYDGDAVIISGNGAYTGRARFYSGKFDLYQRTYAMTLKDDIPQDFIFVLYWIVRLALSKKIMGGTHGSAIPYIVMNDLAKFEFKYDKPAFIELSKIFSAITKTIQSNEEENEFLAEIRDALLPKLMSGAIDVSSLDF